MFYKTPIKVEQVNLNDNVLRDTSKFKWNKKNAKNEMKMIEHDVSLRWNYQDS